MNDEWVVMDRHVVTYVGLLTIEVCSEGLCDEALEWVRRTHPAGTSDNWSNNEKITPVKCEREKGRTHYVFTC